MRNAAEWETMERLVTYGTLRDPLVQQAGGAVDGWVIEVTSDELMRLDDYETKAYQRLRAWVFAEPLG